MTSTQCKNELRPQTKTQQRRLDWAIRNELTEKQRYILLEYYLQEKTISQIARERKVNKSTVCRSLHRAEEKLRNLLRY